MKATWKALNSLLREGSADESLHPEFSVKEFHRHIDDKIECMEKDSHGGPSFLLYV